MNSAKPEFEVPAMPLPAEGTDDDDAQAGWGCECALPFLIPSLQAAAAGKPLRH